MFMFNMFKELKYGLESMCQKQETIFKIILFE